MQRNTTVDVARVLAAYGVIALHIPFSTRAAEWITLFFWPLCVPFFYTASLVYFIGGLKKTLVPTLFARAWFRIVLPYMAWTAVYLGLLLAKNLVTSRPQQYVLHSPDSVDFWRVYLYGESGVQLYFLPILLMMQAMAAGIYLLVVASPKHWVAGGLLLAGAVFHLWFGIYYECFGIATPGAAITVALYIAAAFALAPKMHDVRTKPSYVGVGIAMMLFAIICNSRGQSLLVLDAPMILPIGGIGLLLLAVGYPTCYLPKWLAQLASVSFGIYLCHIVFLEAFEFVANHLYHGAISYSLPFKLLEVSILFAVSAVFVMVLRQVPLLRQVFLGEKAERKAALTPRVVMGA
jgi:surface polysaccharide O-acyltransferase-like enzyme